MTAQLCTLADVKTAMETPVADTSLDDMIQTYIAEASALIVKTCRREFAPVTANLARTFKVSPRGRVNLAPYDLQAATQVMLHPDESQQILAATDYDLAPYTSDEGVYTYMIISPWVTLISTRRLKFGTALVQITGTWGFPTVPAPVKRAAVIAVRTWLRKDARSMAGSVAGQYYSGAELPAELPSTYALPAASRRLLQPYVRSIGAV